MGHLAPAILRAVTTQRFHSSGNDCTACNMQRKMEVGKLRNGLVGRTSSKTRVRFSNLAAPLKAQSGYMTN